MPRVSAGVKTGAGSTTLPIISVYSTASVAPKVREIGVFNTTSSAVDVTVTLLTSAGTQGTGLTETSLDTPGVTPLCTAFTTHTGAPTLGGNCGYRASLGAAIGSGVIWTFGAGGITCPVGTGNGIGVIVENGTGQACQAYIVWDE